MVDAKILRPLSLAGIFLGIGMGGFVDGIFHVFTWTMTAIGISILWRTARRGAVPLLTSYFVGSMALGWGLFNFIEGAIDHHILRVHNVVQRATGVTQVLFDLAFLLSGVVLICLGVYFRRRATSPESEAPKEKLRPSHA